MDQKLIKSLLEAPAYPEPTAEVRLVETHVSFIFITDHFVYKVKKAVDYGFLDFTTLDRRRFYCNEEVRLNRRLCPEVYLGVVELRETPQGAAFSGAGKVIDYAVKMKRLPQERMLDQLLKDGTACAADMASIATAVASFHATAERGAQIDACGSSATIGRNWEQNFSQSAAFVGTTLQAGELAEIRQWVTSFLSDNETLFQARIAAGFIRDCDGDLHSGNICLTDPVCIFDCIEFNERFRYIDTAADLAFLLMDLEYAGRPELARALLCAYGAASGDHGMAPLLDFYKAQRAFVRGKVTSLRLGQPGMPPEESAAVRDAARRYFRLSRGYTLRSRLAPTLILTCGLSGSGKSSLAAEASRELGFDLTRSDLVRKALAGVPAAGIEPDASYRAGIYSEAMDRATYDALLAEAERALADGRGIVVDATFQRRADRERFSMLAARMRVPFLVIETRCPEEVARERLERRRHDPAEVSDARWEQYQRQRAEFQAPQPGESVLLDSTLPVWDEAERVLCAMGLTP
ncbi:bifunctional aminoglycoside phosphotransferase/ATP-binding protein [Geomonas anaerohicana]|uniref:AAA family ATPase n=1 Tax=Geomonas anaerohicana TaxID=2798583 RepID=A0ABS0YH01_9BACT|nr:bifunctional aminoglycoside phosphotransferase/ATP-binding protein [Geomonas anaerohicana]MBJ6751409.1 AAA family ATPase [Geomonas anaerohicana]